MSKGDAARQKKQDYFAKLYSLLDEYKTVFVCNVDNVTSNQMHQIRKTLRGEAVVLMGKNTMVRRALRDKLESNPAFEKLLDVVYGNVGFIFTNGDLRDVRDKILSNRVQAPAKAGAIAPIDVTIPAGNTGMEPGKTSFFQALGVPTKIARGTIEITSDVLILTAGQKVGASEATLLNMLNISPFTYGMAVSTIYDQGTAYSAKILDITEDILIKHLLTGISTVSAISLALPYATTAAVPHLIARTYKNLLAVGITLPDYTFEALENIKNAIANPVAAAPVEAAGGQEAAAEEAAPAEEEEASDDDMGLGLFD